MSHLVPKVMTMESIFIIIKITKQKPKKNLTPPPPKKTPTPVTIKIIVIFSHVDMINDEHFDDIFCPFPSVCLFSFHIRMASYHTGRSIAVLQ